ncbi:hypothetical protein PHYSODRAFT_329589 [Phytophthora sojae]|uniref:SCP domain-containing protein n=1 Tax=Phytophthora sojae (strain P6497) TaxID=1094619 RepID=G4Z5J6_PHYSP|nr:hypothetical protein PHYSODRAFT_329589 [Phytophthora sojae]EGZ21674.1 hypothetical protein PHYSODRAFT_329589 [Phytophthora sojae]|eukprot:XP_009524391.1 hypothetical protein PHYSODRAFT_329589 [Phytophthora sojae]
MALSSSAAAFAVGSQGRVMWQNNCDYNGGDIYSVRGIPDICGDLCANNSKCTHWSWTYFKGGTCWLKSGETAAISNNWGAGCGYVIDRFSSDSDSADQAAQRSQQNADQAQNAEQNQNQNAEQNAEQNADQTSPASQTDQASASQTSQASASSQTSGSTSTSYDNGLTSAETAEMLASINAYRADNGLAALTIDARLVAAAMVHSKDQATHCTMTHDGTDGSEPWDRMEAQGYDWTVSAENVAAGQTSVSAVMTSWWNSAGHRANILKDDVVNVGFALATNSACSEYKTYWTQDFGAL